MHVIKHIYIFLKNNLLQLKRKWLTLPLLLLFPVILIGLVITLFIALINPEEQETIQIGIVDLDQSEETETVVSLLSESSQLGPYIELAALSESEAVKRIDNNQLSAYVTFPKQFTEHLYTGESVTLSVVGNPNQMTESYVVKELIDSVMRHINTSQANILMINRYAKQFAIDDQTRNELLFEQFKSFLIYAISKDKIISDDKLINYVTTSPLHYYGVASWFMLVTVWLLLIYNFLYKDELIRIRNRMKLYGVTQLQQMIARILVTLFITSVLALISLLGLEKLLSFDLFREDYGRIMLVLILHSIIFLQLLVILEFLITSQKMRLLLQVLLTFILIGLSGAVIPAIYFPLPVQDMLLYVSSFEAFYWFQEIFLMERLYADYSYLLKIAFAGFVILLSFSFWKERVRL